MTACPTPTHAQLLASIRCNRTQCIPLCLFTQDTLSAPLVPSQDAAPRLSPHARLRCPQDPHLYFAHGGTADFRGRNGQHYCLLSAPRLAINIKTEDATFQLHNLHDKGGTLDVDGSFITEVHVVARVGGRKNKLCLASFWASEVNEFNTGFNMVNGTCGGGPFFVGTGASKRCEEMLIAVRFSSAEFTIGDWVALVRANWVYGHISGPAHRLDVSLRARGGVAARHLPHGLVGQSFASAAPRFGRVDEYPASGTFRTSAMAEGAAARARPNKPQRVF